MSLQSTLKGLSTLMPYIRQPGNYTRPRNSSIASSERVIYIAQANFTLRENVLKAKWPQGFKSALCIQRTTISVSLQLLYQSIRNKVVQSGLTFGCLWIFHRGKGWGMARHLCRAAEERKKKKKDRKKINPTKQ